MHPNKRLPKAAQAPNPQQFGKAMLPGAIRVEALAHDWWNNHSQRENPFDLVFAGGFFGHGNRKATPTPSIKPSAPREFLKGLAKLRRQVVTPASIDPNPVSIRYAYDENGNTLHPDEVVVYRRTGVATDVFKSMRKLGSGHYASVYELDEHRVIKVVQENREADEYDRYLDLAIKNQHNPHFPKIYYRGKWGTRKVYVMERLEDEDYDLRDKFCRIVRLGNNPFVKYIDPLISEAAELLQKHRMTNDLKADNVLVRKDGTIVITDPVAG